MKVIKSKIKWGVVILIVLGFYIDTGGFPSDDTLVYLNPSRNIYYSPARTPANSGYVPTSYKNAIEIGAHADESDLFYINKPPLIISLLQGVAGVSIWPDYWGESSTTVEKFQD